jgi:uncharacterized protein YbcV (DUF1398 family)
MMFTIEQINIAHSKVNTGADFPAYIQAIKLLGVIQYKTFVLDGHTNYYGTQNFKTSSPAIYNTLQVANIANKEAFKIAIKAHQQGQTAYKTFCNDCALAGIEKWVVCLTEMTCSYFDKAGNEIVVEQIPQ